MYKPRIATFLPSATEMVCALGLGEQLVGVSHECDYPPQVKALPRLTRNTIPVDTMSQAEIDAAVAARLRTGAAIYEIDEETLRALAPDILVTQELCEVCAPSNKDLAAVMAELPKQPRVLGFSPSSLADIFDNMSTLAAATGVAARAAALIADSQQRLARLRAAVAQRARPRVFCMEWIEPPYCSGHWVPELVEIAGGIDALGRKGADSVRVPWEDICRWAPEVMVIMPCGYDLKDAVALAKTLPTLPGWADLPAVRAQRVYAVDANAFFARPGPRVVDGAELLAQIIHPDITWPSAHEGTTVQLRTKACSACAAPFICLPVSGCWCEGVCVGERVLKDLEQTYADCLCPACLEFTAQAQ